MRCPAPPPSSGPVVGSPSVPQAARDTLAMTLARAASYFARAFDIVRIIWHAHCQHVLLAEPLWSLHVAPVLFTLLLCCGTAVTTLMIWQIDFEGSPILPAELL